MGPGGDGGIFQASGQRRSGFWMKDPIWSYISCREQSHGQSGTTFACFGSRETLHHYLSLYKMLCLTNESDYY